MSCPASDKYIAKDVSHLADTEYCYRLVGTAFKGMF